MDEPLFSIITVTYNVEKELPHTLHSLNKQQFKDFEIILVDGASSDKTVEIAQNYGLENLSLISEPDKGIYDAMNKGIRMAKGKFILFLNAGDALCDESVLSNLDRNLKGNDVDIIYGDTVLVNSDREWIKMRKLTPPRKLTRYSFLWGMLVCHQSFVVRRTIAPEYDLQYRFSADYDWCIRCIQNSKRNLFCDKVISEYLMGGTTDKNHRASLIERFKIMSKYYTGIMAVIMHVCFIVRIIFYKFRGDKNLKPISGRNK